MNLTHFGLSLDQEFTSEDFTWNTHNLVNFNSECEHKGNEEEKEYFTMRRVNETFSASLTSKQTEFT